MIVTKAMRLIAITLNLLILACGSAESVDINAPSDTNIQSIAPEQQEVNTVPADPDTQSTPNQTGASADRCPPDCIYYTRRSDGITECRSCCYTATCKWVCQPWRRC